ncbi:MAG: DUF3105 domain-containing protein [Thermoleophilia bacterium]|nr:DUF3105 domain-containing protein [Thermoleophilia bacterium]
MPPKQRPGRVPTNERDSKRTLVSMVVAGLVVIVGAGALYLIGGEDAPGDAKEEARVALAAAGCELLIHDAPANAADHTDITTPEGVSPGWKTDPPTAGPHFRETLVYGAYDEPVQQARVVHNLEHGAVFIQYGEGVAAATVEELHGFYAKNRTGTILASYPALGEQIALGAWNDEGEGGGQGVLATCTAFDDSAFQAFLSAYQFRGPERFSPSQMAPGDL